eukprot:767188-Hanusia_phi.AAC.3
MPCSLGAWQAKRREEGGREKLKQDLEDFMGPRSAKKIKMAEDILEEKCVLGLSCHGDQVTARVKGTNPYDVAFCLVDGGKWKDQTCNCPDGSKNSGKCKHFAAVMLLCYDDEQAGTLGSSQASTTNYEERGGAFTSEAEQHTSNGVVTSGGEDVRVRSVYKLKSGREVPGWIGEEINKSTSTKKKKNDTSNQTTAQRGQKRKRHIVLNAQRRTSGEDEDEDEEQDVLPAVDIPPSPLKPGRAGQKLEGKKDETAENDDDEPLDKTRKKRQESRAVVSKRSRGKETEDTLEVIGESETEMLAAGSASKTANRATEKSGRSQEAAEKAEEKIGSASESGSQQKPEEKKDLNQGLADNLMKKLLAPDSDEEEEEERNRQTTNSNRVRADEGSSSKGVDASSSTRAQPRAATSQTEGEGAKKAAKPKVSALEMLQKLKRS